MVPWREIGRATVGTETLVLSQRGEEFAIRMRGAELMNSRSHASEEALARLGLAALAKVGHARVLIGGLGMGFTLRTALDCLRPDAQVTVAELVPEVVAWNRDHLSHLTRQPLDDPRVTLHVGDVAKAIRDAKQPWHAILLDVDNGPDAFTQGDNFRLYSPAGLTAAYRALRPHGALAVWSLDADPTFEKRMRSAGFEPSSHRVTAHGTKGKRHTVFIGRKP
jgi:spermidine synthase